MTYGLSRLRLIIRDRIYLLSCLCQNRIFVIPLLVLELAAPPLLVLGFVNLSCFGLLLAVGTLVDLINLHLGDEPVVLEHLLVDWLR